MVKLAARWAPHVLMSRGDGLRQPGEGGNVPVMWSDLGMRVG